MSLSLYLVSFPLIIIDMLGVSGGIRFGKINFRKRLITIPKNVKIEVLHILEDRTVCLFHITTEKPKYVVLIIIKCLGLLLFIAMEMQRIVEVCFHVVSRCLKN